MPRKASGFLSLSPRAGFLNSERMTRDLTPTGAIVLAAGAALRMGQLKQLLPFGNTTLLGHAIQHAQQAAFERLVVVLGAEAGRVHEAIRPLSVDTVVNENWQAGMGSSITTGLHHLETTGDPLSAVAILLADQPHVGAEHLLALRELLENTGLSVAAAEYGGKPGVPALFRREKFSLLSALPPEAGARHLLRHSDLPMARYPLPEAAADIDTPSDFAALRTVRT
jgi:molybdenum cofactor cytidylyltransferase